jgi:HTH-type transcriptional regulator / antitoxin HigA
MGLTSEPVSIVHPGIVLKDILDKRGWSQSELTFVLGCNPKAVNQIINGKQGISPAMSKALGEALGLPPDYFANIQQSFDLATAIAPDPSVSLRAMMQKNYPVREMVKRGWIKGDESTDLSDQLASFFGVSDISQVPYITHSAKKTIYEEREIPAPQLAWLFRVKQVAASITVPAYSEAKLRSAIEKMKDFLAAPEEARNVPRLLAECGVRFIIVETLPNSKIDGVCFWLNEQSPVIGLTTRFDRIDNFWFVLRHEIEHVLRKHGQFKPEGMIDADLRGDASNNAGTIPEEEKLANEAASDFCVPSAKMESFFLRKNPFFYEKDVVAFAKLNNVHPSLPIGQIQHRLARYEYLKKYQTKIRQFVLPGAIVDGWGQTANLN